MINNSNKHKPAIDIKDLMRIVETFYSTGVNFHIYKRKRIPSMIEMGSVTDEGWEVFRQELQADFHWNADDELNITQKLGLPEARSMNYIHLHGGATVYRNADGWIVLVYDHDCDSELLKELKYRIKTICNKSTMHEIGFLQITGAHLHVRFCQYKPYENDLVPFMGEPVVEFRNQMLKHLNEENGNGLYLLHGNPGTGKTSFIKSVLSRTRRKAIYLSASMTEKLTSPDMIGLLTGYPDSILVIEDAETTLMKRAGDNSSAVSNLLNMSDGFPADFLNLCIICTFNTELDNIDPALLRKGRLKGMFEFKPLREEQARKIAGVLGVSGNINYPVTIAELCNSQSVSAKYQTRNVGFQTINSI